MILQGIRVLSFTTGIAGPNAGRILASLGADVIKVESRAGGIDAFRYFGVGDDLDSSARFAEANLGVRSVAVNLKDPAGLDVVLRIAAHADVILENYRPGVLDRLGLSYERLRSVRPDIIVVRMPGLGSTGPMRGYGTWGALLNAYSGLTWLWNHAGAEVPVGNQGVFPDYLSSVLAPMVVVSALHGRADSGQGCEIDLAQSEATAFCALPVSMAQVGIDGADPLPVGARSRTPAIQGVYRCAGTDRWCAVRADTDEAVAALLGLVASDVDAADRPASLEAAVTDHDRVDGWIEAWTSSRSASEAMSTLQDAGVAAGLVASGEDLLADPQLARSGFIRQLDQPGIGTMTIPGLPMQMAPSIIDEPGPAAALGADTRSVLRDLLGMPADEYDRLDAAGVLR